MNFSPVSTRRASFSGAALIIGIAFAGCSGGSNSATPTLPQANQMPAPQGERELARVTVPAGLNLTPVNLRVHALQRAGGPPVINRTYAGALRKAHVPPTADASLTTVARCSTTPAQSTCT